jgi:hypothetical protein
MGCWVSRNRYTLDRKALIDDVATKHAKIADDLKELQSTLKTLQKQFDERALETIYGPGNLGMTDISILNAWAEDIQSTPAKCEHCGSTTGRSVPSHQLRKDPPTN